jgi:hypothetical protein
MIEASLSANILDIILNLKLAMAMGLNWFKEPALLVLEIRTRVLELKLGNNQPVVKN